MGAGKLLLGVGGGVTGGTVGLMGGSGTGTTGSTFELGGGVGMTGSTDGLGWAGAELEGVIVILAWLPLK